MPDSHTDRLTRARSALEGLSVADAFAGFFEMARPSVLAEFVRARRLVNPPWRFTDDTSMALSIYEILRDCEGIDQDRLARSFGIRYDIRRGYGMAMHHLLPLYRQGADWRDLAASLFQGTGSFGNGAAMRVAPVGGYFADNLQLAVENAHRSAEVTHAHPEAIAGAIAVAVAAVLAYRLRAASPRPTRQEFLDLVLPHVPTGDVLAGIQSARDLPPGTPVQDAVQKLGNGSQISAQDTVPFTLWCAGEQLNSYEEAFWLTLSGGGDADTTCAIVGGIVALSTGHDAIPAEWRTRREPLPEWAVRDI
jgi:ADP-ribosylglycohydrolase